ncbi:hypothetical protein TEA_025454 [Camellia sinensis var. sinensis]|uniref:Uncharacterized protein n=1 Tax=Camellia sinensis var. sinensis TaxID=542762 RepID=A0A4S4DFY6_CAMSN|nr:hypothetical protein TEA_025454 [Camellia sinensis var. sinensis]
MNQDIGVAYNSLASLPRGIIQAGSDLELKPLWSTSSLREKVDVSSSHNLLAIPVGIKQKSNVDVIVQKFLSENFTIILFHYDGNMDGWWDLPWSKNATHIVAQNQTKWWYAKRFLHPAVVSIYDYIFLWDEDLGVENFHPGRYLHIVKSEGLEISQPALDPNSTEESGMLEAVQSVQRTAMVHHAQGKFVEGMAPVFSRSAWHCAWHLIQNDLVHGWGMDMKLGYCAQGDRTKNVGVVDSEYIVHQAIPTLGGPSAKKASNPEESMKKPTFDMRAEIRRQSTSELLTFKKRWDQAVKQDRKARSPLKDQHFLRSQSPNIINTQSTFPRRNNLGHTEEDD